MPQVPRETNSMCSTLKQRSSQTAELILRTCIFLALQKSLLFNNRTVASILSDVMHQLYGLRTCEGKNKVPSTPPNTVREQIHTHSHPIETHTHKHTQSCTHSLQTHGENAHSAAVECQFRWIQVIQFAKQTLQYEVYIQ